MALYQDGILISGANQLPQMTLAEWQALPSAERPTYWICTDREYEEMSVDFTEASTRSNINSGETLSTLFGKIKKFFSDLKNHAFTALDTGSIDIGGMAGGQQYVYAKGVNDFSYNNGVIQISKRTGYNSYDTELIPVPNSNDYVAKTGDTMSGALNIEHSGSDTPLVLKGNSANASFIAIKNNANTILGYLYGRNNNRAGYYYSNAYHDFAYLSELDTKVNLNATGVNGVGYCAGGGQYNYFKIATFTITQAYINGPIAFELSQRQYPVTMLQVSFASTSSTDPALSYFVTNQGTNYWIKKTATSTWELYGKYNESWGNAVIHRVFGKANNNGVTVTINMTNVSDPTSGATQATYGGNCYYAVTASQDENGNSIPSNYASSLRILAQGSYRFQYDLYAKSGALLSSGQVTISTSSRKFKKNIAPLSEDDARKILDVETVTFDYKKDHDNYTSRKGYKNIGCIAEDVNEIIPEVVIEDENNEIFGINYIEMIPYLIKMVQIQQKEIEELKAIIKANE